MFITYVCNADDVTITCLRCILLGGKPRGTKGVFATEVDDDVRPPTKPKKIKKTRKTPLPTDSKTPQPSKTPVPQKEATKYEGTCRFCKFNLSLSRSPLNAAAVTTEKSTNAAARVA